MRKLKLRCPTLDDMDRLTRIMTQDITIVVVIRGH
jgi:hypothetical protein